MPSSFALPSADATQFLSIAFLGLAYSMLGVLRDIYMHSNLEMVPMYIEVCLPDIHLLHHKRLT